MAMWAMECTPRIWSQDTQADADENLWKKRQKDRKLLNFVGLAVKNQRKRGGAVLGENPAGSKAWQEPAIEEAFENMSECITDMCQYGLKKPKTEFEGEEEFLRKRTRLRGTKEIIERRSRRCDGKGQVHEPVLGGVKIGGHWKPLSDFAGGYTCRFAQQVVQGAEKYRKNGRRQEVYAQKELVPEERFEPMEEEEQPEEDEEMEEYQMKMTRLDLVRRRLGHPSNEVLLGRSS